MSFGVVEIPSGDLLVNTARHPIWRHLSAIVAVSALLGLAPFVSSCTCSSASEHATPSARPSASNAPLVLPGKFALATLQPSCVGKLPAHVVMVSSSSQCGSVDAERISITLVGTSIEAPRQLRIGAGANPELTALHCQAGGGVCEPARAGRVVIEKFTAGASVQGSYSLDFSAGRTYSGKLDAKWCEAGRVLECWLDPGSLDGASDAALRK